MGKGPDHAQAKDGTGKKKKVAGQARELRALEIKMEWWDRRDRRWSVTRKNTKCQGLAQAPQHTINLKLFQLYVYVPTLIAAQSHVFISLCEILCVSY